MPMRIENGSILMGDVPKPLNDSLKVGEKIMGSLVGPEMQDVTVHVVSGKQLIDLETDSFVADNLLGKMAKEQGIDPSLFVTTSHFGTLIENGAGRDIYLSSDFLKPIYHLNKKDIHQRGFLSDGCVYAFFIYQDLLLHSLPSEKPFKATDALVDELIPAIPRYLRTDEFQSNPKIGEFAQEFEEYLRSGRNDISTSFKGLELNVFLRDEKVFSVFTGEDQAVRTIIGRPLVDNFIRHMRDRNIWFGTTDNLNFGVDERDERMVFAKEAIRLDDDIKSVGDVFRKYKASEIGLITGEELVKQLTIANVAQDEITEPEQQGEQVDLFEFEEMEENIDYRISGRRVRKGSKVKWND